MRPDPAVVFGLAALAVFLGGCAWYGETFTALPTTAEALHEIAPLDPASLPAAPAPSSAAAAPPPPPPAELTLGVEACRAAALSNNLGLQAVLVEPAIAAARISEEEARFEATFQTSLAYAAQHRATGVRPETALRQETWEALTGVELPLRTGGTLRFDLADRQSRRDPAGGAMDPTYEPSATVSISQPLLRQAGRRVNTHAIRLARLGEQAVQASTRLEVIRVLAAVDRVYWRLYASRRVLEVRRQDYELAERQLETARRLVDSGARSVVEVMRAESALASRLEGIIAAENAVRERQRELKRVIHRDDLPLHSETVLIPSSEPDPVRYDLDRPAMVARTCRQRMELLEIELQLAQDDSTIEALRNDLLPLVMLDYSYGLQGLGESRSEAWDLLDSRRYGQHRVGVSLVVPIGNVAAESRLRQALLSRRQRLQSKADREALIEQEVLAACDSLETAWQRILANRQSALLAERLLETERRQFALGLNTSNDVLAAQADLADAQSAEIAALTEYQIALVDLAYATGTVLGSARLRWDDAPAAP
ncbi:MAG: TolC family protein [Lentisphaerae bacterium]|nr:TolC family protein [Lentisphaerota bacterium]